MKSYYEKLVEEKGEAAAKEYMRSIRSKVKNHPGGALNDPVMGDKIRAKAQEAIQKKHEDKQAIDAQDTTKS